MALLRAGGLGGGGLSVSRLQSGQIINVGPITVLAPNASFFLPDNLPVIVPQGEAGTADYTVDLTSLSALPAGLSLAQPGTSTYFNSSGILTTASANTPRFGYTYNGTSWIARGLLIEGQPRTNVLIQTNNFTTTWVAQSVALTSAATTSPDGTTNAWKLAETAVTDFHKMYQGPTTSTAGTWTYSFFAKAAERNWVYFGIGPTGSGAYAFFDLSAGVVGNVGTNTTGFIENVGNGWYRISARITGIAASVTNWFAIFTALANGTGDPSYAGTAGSGIYIAFAQEELGANASSYIPATTAAVTRAADVLTATGALDAILSAPGGSIVIGSYIVDIGTNGRLLGNISGSQGIYISSNTAAGVQGGSSAATVTLGGSGVYIGNRALTGLAWDWTSGSLAADQGTASPVLMGPQFGSGAYFFRDAAGTAAVSGFLGSISAWAGRLSNTDLIAATALAEHYTHSASDTVVSSIDFGANIKAVAPSVSATVASSAVEVGIHGTTGAPSATLVSGSSLAAKSARILSALTGSVVSGSTIPAIKKISVAITHSQATSNSITAARGAVTLDPAKKSSTITLSGGDLVATGSATGDRMVQGTTARGDGYYYEGTGATGYGVGNTSANLDSFFGSTGGDDSIGYYSGQVFGIGENDTSVPTFTSTDVIGVGVKLIGGALKIQWWKNGTLVKTSNFSPSGSIYPQLEVDTGFTATVNFGATTLAHLPPNFISWDGSQVGATAITATVASGSTISGIKKATAALTQTITSGSTVVGGKKVTVSISHTTTSAGVFGALKKSTSKSVSATVVSSAVEVGVHGTTRAVSATAVLGFSMTVLAARRNTVTASISQGSSLTGLRKAATAPVSGTVASGSTIGDRKAATAIVTHTTVSGSSITARKVSAISAPLTHSTVPGSSTVDVKHATVAITDSVVPSYVVHAGVSHTVAVTGSVASSSVLVGRKSVSLTANGGVASGSSSTDTKAEAVSLSGTVTAGSAIAPRKSVSVSISHTVVSSSNTISLKTKTVTLSGTVISSGSATDIKKIATAINHTLVLGFVLQASRSALATATHSTVSGYSYSYRKAEAGAASGSSAPSGVVTWAKATSGSASNTQASAAVLVSLKRVRQAASASAVLGSSVVTAKNIAVSISGSVASSSGIIGGNSTPHLSGTAEHTTASSGVAVGHKGSVVVLTGALTIGFSLTGTAKGGVRQVTDAVASGGTATYARASLATVSGSVASTSQPISAHKFESGTISASIASSSVIVAYVANNPVVSVSHATTTSGLAAAKKAVDVRLTDETLALASMAFSKRSSRTASDAIISSTIVGPAQRGVVITLLGQITAYSATDKTKHVGIVLADNVAASSLLVGVLHLSSIDKIVQGEWTGPQTLAGTDTIDIVQGDWESQKVVGGRDDLYVIEGEWEPRRTIVGD